MREKNAATFRPKTYGKHFSDQYKTLDLFSGRGRARSAGSNTSLSVMCHFSLEYFLRITYESENVPNWQRVAWVCSECDIEATRPGQGAPFTFFDIQPPPEVDSAHQRGISRHLRIHMRLWKNFCVARYWQKVLQRKVCMCQKT